MKNVKLGRILSKREIDFCCKNQLQYGYHVDTTPIQWRHIVLVKTHETAQALCKTKDLWGYGIWDLDGDKENNRVTCKKCLLEFDKIYK